MWSFTQSILSEDVFKPKDLFICGAKGEAPMIQFITSLGNNFITSDGENFMVKNG